MKVDVQGYEGLYQIDINGNIYSVRKNIIMKQRSHPQGYKLINFWKNSKRKTYRVHILIALHFIENPKNKSQINHIDGNKANNKIENLEWVTSQENIRHSFDILKNKSSSYPGRKQKTNINGMQGVLEKKDGRKNRFMARISINGKVKSLGHYKTAKEAGEAYQKEALKYSKNK